MNKKECFCCTINATKQRKKTRGKKKKKREKKGEVDSANASETQELKKKKILAVFVQIIDRKKRSNFQENPEKVEIYYDR